MRPCHLLVLASTVLWVAACEDLPRREPVFNDWDVVDTGSSVTLDAVSDAGTDSVPADDGASLTADAIPVDTSPESSPDAATDADPSEWPDGDAVSHDDTGSDTDADADPDSADEDVLQGGGN